MERVPAGEGRCRVSDGPIEEGGCHRCNGCTFLREDGQFCAHPTVQRYVAAAGKVSVIRFLATSDRTPKWCPFLVEDKSC